MRHIRYRDWRSADELDLGTHDGTATREPSSDTGWSSPDTGWSSPDIGWSSLSRPSLVIVNPSQSREYVDPHRDGRTGSFEQATWTSPEVTPEFPVTEVVASWNATTPAGTWLEVEVAATMDDGTRTKWYVLGRWAEGDRDISPTSVPGQGDGNADVAQDTLTTRQNRTLSTYQVRVHLMRAAGSDASPLVSLVGVMASSVAADHTVPRSPSGGAEGTLLEVPAYSQMIHRGEYPQWDNGGQSWCSPTATMMVLGRWGNGPTGEDYAWVDPSYQDRFVDYAARHTYDHDYGGAGNWTFNTAYAARYGVIAYVTRLRSLTEAEQFIKAGIPLVVSVSFGKDQLEGAGYETAGHLLTIVGFDADGNVISNDPASHGIASNEQVRTTYDREQFENAWIVPTGGIVYVIHPPDVEPPDPPAGEPNWR